MGGLAWTILIPQLYVHIDTASIQAIHSDHPAASAGECWRQWSQAIHAFSGGGGGGGGMLWPARALSKQNSQWTVLTFY